jgi:hypothetical protein
MHNSGASCREIVKSYSSSFYGVQLYIVVRANVRVPMRCAFTAGISLSQEIASQESRRFAEYFSP